MVRFVGLLAGLLALSGPAWAQQTPPPDRAGDAYELTLRIRSESLSSDGSSSLSNSGGTLVERVLATRPDGLELEFDLPADATPDERASEWQWPARVLWSETAPPVLLNGAELEQRLDAWLTVAEIPREACDHWLFSWTAFKIECDPDSVLELLTAYDLRSRLDGAGPGPTEGSTRVETALDPDQVRREMAESDRVVAEITGADPLTFEQALAARASEQIAGTETVTREIDAQGRPVRQVRTVRLEITAANGAVEQNSTTQTLTRTPLPAPR